MAFTIRRCHPHIFFITLITLITNFIFTISILTTTTRLGMCPPRRIRLRRRLPLQRPSLPEEEEVVEEVVGVMVQVLVPWALIHPITPKITSEEEDVVPAITTTTTTRTSFTTSSSSITTNTSHRSRRMWSPPPLMAITTITTTLPWLLLALLLLLLLLPLPHRPLQWPG